jgi:hypothetical protein
MDRAADVITRLFAGDGELHAPDIGLTGGERDMKVVAARLVITDIGRLGIENVATGAVEQRVRQDTSILPTKRAQELERLRRGALTLGRRHHEVAHQQRRLRLGADAIETRLEIGIEPPRGLRGGRQQRLVADFGERPLHRAIVEKSHRGQGDKRHRHEREQGLPAQRRDRQIPGPANKVP